MYAVFPLRQLRICYSIEFSDSLMCLLICLMTRLSLHPPLWLMDTEYTHNTKRVHSLRNVVRLRCVCVLILRGPKACWFRLMDVTQLCHTDFTSSNHLGYPLSHCLSRVEVVPLNATYSYCRHWACVLNLFLFLQMVGHISPTTSLLLWSTCILRFIYGKNKDITPLRMYGLIADGETHIFCLFPSFHAIAHVYGLFADGETHIFCLFASLIPYTDHIATFRTDWDLGTRLGFPKQQQQQCQKRDLKI